ncbi:hypothetical protein ACLB2K_004742 [Fragaria x ananassa]
MLMLPYWETYRREVLVVQEKHCSPSYVCLWKIPTRFILESEEIFTGAVKEVKEETGIDTEFVKVIAFRNHMPPLMKRKSRQEAFKRCYEQAVQQLGPRPVNPPTVAAPPLESLSTLAPPIIRTADPPPNAPTPPECEGPLISARRAFPKESSENEKLRREGESLYLTNGFEVAYDAPHNGIAAEKANDMRQKILRMLSEPQLDTPEDELLQQVDLQSQLDAFEKSFSSEKKSDVQPSFWLPSVPLAPPRPHLDNRANLPRRLQAAEAQRSWKPQPLHLWSEFPSPLTSGNETYFIVVVSSRTSMAEWVAPSSS